MKLVITTALLLMSVIASANDCSDIKNLSTKKNCVVRNNGEFINSVSDSVPWRTLTERMRGCSYEMPQVALKTVGNGCSYSEPCLLLSTNGEVKSRNNNRILENVRLEGFKLKFRRYRLSCN